jgi:hypothetical protein
MNSKVGCRSLSVAVVFLLFWLAAAGGSADVPDKFALRANPNRLVPKHSAPAAGFMLAEQLPSKQQRPAQNDCRDLGFAVPQLLGATNSV